MTTSVQEMARRGVDGAVAQTAAALAPDVVARLVLDGDLSRLTDSQKVAYYNTLCVRVGLDPATQPFKLLKLDGKLVMYADKGAAQQLSDQRHISHQVVSREKFDDVYSVTVRATMPDGRFTDEDGIVSLTDFKDGKEIVLKGKALANAMMRATTKAKRRAVLALLGLGIMDETELDTVAGQTVEMPALPPPVVHEPKALPEPKPEQKSPIPWIDTAGMSLLACIRAGDQEKAQEWGLEARRRAEQGEITREQLDGLRAMYYKAWPPKPQPLPGLFDNEGKPKEDTKGPVVPPKAYPTPEQKAKQDEANAERNELAQTPPVDPYEEEAKKKDTKKKRGQAVDTFTDLTEQVAKATKASILFTLRSKVDKAAITDGQRKALYTSLDAKLAEVKKGAKK